MEHSRRNHYDVTDQVCIADPLEVETAVRAILLARFPELDFAPLAQAFDTFTRLYAGDLPGYVGCDTWYHDAQHSLDCTLAMARLLDGHERSVAAPEALGARRAALGTIIALFHDAGYIRREGDSAANGAEYTLYHVGRSAEFLREFLPRVGFAAEAELASRVVHYTGYEIALDQIEVTDPKDRRLGFVLGTSDMLAQLADRCYLEKCRDFLYREFAVCGLAGEPRPGGPAPLYSSPEDLLVKTPRFHDKVRSERLDGYFQGVHRYYSAHFGGEDAYSSAVQKHLSYVELLAHTGRLDLLRRHPTVIGAQHMRAALHAKQKSLRVAA